jgi:hypothetical protein
MRLSNQDFAAILLAVFALFFLAATFVTAAITVYANPECV